MLSKFLEVGLAGWVLVALMALFAYLGGMLTTAQMQAQGIREGINFENHGSTWWVVGGLVPLTAMLVGLYAGQWPAAWGAWLPKVALAGAITVGVHLMYTFAPYPDFMVARKWVPSFAALPHMVLMWGVIAVLLMTFFATPNLHSPVAAFTAVYVTWHVFVGNHMLQKLNPPPGFPPYEFWDAGPIGTICAVGVIMAGATWWALR
jgi:hypothetical protein